jgi:hypothetical protein
VIRKERETKTATFRTLGLDGPVCSEVFRYEPKSVREQP